MRLELLSLFSCFLSLPTLKVDVNVERSRNAGATPGKIRLHFKVCGDVAEQHVSLIHGIALGHAINASVVPPDILDDDGHTHVFTDVYDKDFLRLALKDVVDILPPAPRIINYGIEKELARPSHAGEGYGTGLTLQAWADKVNSHFSRGTWGDVRLNCTYNAVSAIQNAETMDLFWKIDKALRFSRPIQELAELIVSKIHDRVADQASPSAFTALRLHTNDSCMHVANKECAAADALRNVLMIERVRDSNPVYLTESRGVDSGLLEAHLAELRSLYQVHTKVDLAGEEALRLPGKLDWRGALGYVDLAVSSQASVFVGSGADAFSALNELRRRREDPPSRPTAFHYNGGALPLALVMPVSHESGDGDLPAMARAPLKWIFRLHKLSDRPYIDMAKAAVLSALSRTALLPYCIYSGAEENSPPDETEMWLIRRGVGVIRDDPEPAAGDGDGGGELYKQGAARSFQNMRSKEVQLASVMRLDFSELGFLDTHVLYTHADILFLRDPDFARLAGNLTHFLTMGSDSKYPGGQCPANYGVMLLNIREPKSPARKSARKSAPRRKAKADRCQAGPHQALLETEAPDHSGGMTLVRAPLFNWRPFWATTAEERGAVSILHMEGPKMQDYEAFETNGTVRSTSDAGMLQECGRRRATCQPWIRDWREALTCAGDVGACPPVPRAAEIPPMPILQISVGESSD